jgi:hypothetical protein
LAGSLPRTGDRAGAGPAEAAAAIGTGLFAVVVLRTTMLPTVGTWDTAEAQTVLPVLGTMHSTGFPAYVVLGWLASLVLAPLGTPAFLANLLSALLVGVATGGVVLVAYRLGAALPLAVATGAGFALTPTVWAIGTAADAHALHVALLALLVLALLRWEGLAGRRREDPADPALVRRADRALVLAALVFGVSVANHALTLLLIPAVGLFVLAVEPRILVRPRLVASALAASLGIGALLYLELPLRAGPFRAPLVYGHPETWDGFWEIVLARQFQGDIVGPLADPGGRLAALAALAGDQLGLLAVVAVAGFAWTIVRHPRYALLSGVAAGVTVLFAASYLNARIDRYYLGPAFFAWTWIAALGAGIVDAIAGRVAPGGSGRWRTGWGRAQGWRGARALLSLALGAALLVPTVVALPDRWAAHDRSRDTWVETWLDEALAAMESDAVVVSWWSYSTPLWYAQVVEGRRPDVAIVDDRTLLDLGMHEVEQAIDLHLGRRPVYLLRMEQSEIAELARRYTIEPVGRPGNLYRITGRRESTP